jgi:hypothetical protein
LKPGQKLRSGSVRFKFVVQTKSRATEIGAAFFLAVVVTTFFLHRANECGIIRHMIGLTDIQLKIIMHAARLIPVEK